MLLEINNTFKDFQNGGTALYTYEQFTSFTYGMNAFIPDVVKAAISVGQHPVCKAVSLALGSRNIVQAASQDLISSAINSIRLMANGVKFQNLLSPFKGDEKNVADQVILIATSIECTLNARNCVHYLKSAYHTRDWKSLCIGLLSLSFAVSNLYFIHKMYEDPY